MKFPTGMRALLRMTGTLLCLFATAAFGQKQPVYVHGYLGAGAGNVMHSSAGLQVRFFERHGLGFGYQRYRRKAATTPADYTVSDFIFPGMYPQEVLDGVSFEYTYYLHAARRRKLFRFPISLGVLTGIYSMPGNFHRVAGWSISYGYDDISSPATAIVAQVGVEFTPTRAFGVRLSLFGVLNKLPSFGVSTGILLGRVGGWRKGDDW